MDLYAFGAFEDASCKAISICHSHTLIPHQVPPKLVTNTLSFAALLAAVPMNWALGPQNALVQHSIMGSVELNLAGGTARSIADDSATNNAYRAAHGALMLTAFVLLMPSAVLMARHKWLFGDRKVWSWFLVLRSLRCVRYPPAILHCCVNGMFSTLAVHYFCSVLALHCSLTELLAY